MFLRAPLSTLAALLLLMGAAPSASAHVGWGHSYYAGSLSPGQFTSPGSGYDYCWTDGVVAYWNGNAIQKSVAALGKLIWIDTSGRWRAAVETAESTMVYYISPQNWNKKLTAKNTSSASTYFATTDGQRDQAMNCA